MIVRSCLLKTQAETILFISVLAIPVKSQHEMQPNMQPLLTDVICIYYLKCVSSAGLNSVTLTKKPHKLVLRERATEIQFLSISMLMFSYHALVSMNTRQDSFCCEKHISLGRLVYINVTRVLVCWSVIYLAITNVIKRIMTCLSLAPGCEKQTRFSLVCQKVIFRREETV